ncbi:MULTISPECIES: hypothetical protein [unclassified Mesorhizobium]|uniref:hypothetical protein n=1 Tax=unclassified Mesorhizobium TaxID=325217 RepID=UPI000FCBFB22|nr:MULTISPECIES: hypothetical protein [unclassified Mesorhizobium]RUV24883.1 hypothetical protein EOA91_10485 [Mesorhizobium sp. M1A.F.Ca.IN.022.04.1.1]RWG33375.1 MAG: hypothetical protein EOQ60_11750 [Mesorhizobium sp.]TIS18270.1 MAG: hypothetical protein E5X10_00170 [Mesorhizobium sp.]
MPESITHASLVQNLIAYVEHELGNLADIAVREDALRPIRGERPPRIEGFVPDVYATDVPTTTTFIGEAKTRRDLETEHSRKQISAFLSYLSKTPSGVFVLSVPPMTGATARRLLNEMSLIGAATRTVVLDRAGVRGR